MHGAELWAVMPDPYLVSAVISRMCAHLVMSSDQASSCPGTGTFLSSNQKAAAPLRSLPSKHHQIAVRMVLVTAFRVSVLSVRADCAASCCSNCPHIELTARSFHISSLECCFPKPRGSCSRSFSSRIDQQRLHQSRPLCLICRAWSCPELPTQANLLGSVASFLKILMGICHGFVPQPCLAQPGVINWVFFQNLLVSAGAPGPAHAPRSRLFRRATLVACIYPDCFPEKPLGISALACFSSIFQCCVDPAVNFPATFGLCCSYLESCFWTVQM